MDITLLNQRRRLGEKIQSTHILSVGSFLAALRSVNQIVYNGCTFGRCFGSTWLNCCTAVLVVAVIGRRTRDLRVAGSTPGRDAIKSTRSTQPSIPPG